VYSSLELLKLTGIGPAQQIECEFAPRLNLITGDNGLGKTFLLECAWWTLTGTWIGYSPYPRQDASKDLASITFRISTEKNIDGIQQVKYDWNSLSWNTPNHHVLPGLAIFAQVDDSFTVWEPTSLSLGEGYQDEKNSGKLTHFSLSEVWDGVRTTQGTKSVVVCNGLIQDWVLWQFSPDQTRFNELSTVLKALSPPSTEEPLVPGLPTRVPGDARSLPTLKFSYGEVPILLCSAGIQRIVALAYLLVWAWNEHVVNSKLMRKDPVSTIVFLIDEMESHLHPFWQRTIIPALMNLAQILSKEVHTQMLVATHSPLVLASVEPLFDADKDKLFHLSLENGSASLEDVPFVRRGRIDLWLMSDIFGLKQPRSKVAEEVIERAKSLQLKREPPSEEVQKVSEDLVKVLAPDDQFWPRWTYFAEKHGVVW
jgi:AAA domain, putative AbiEii toxin, Type IV TA system/AAA domain